MVEWPWENDLSLWQFVSDREENICTQGIVSCLNFIKSSSGKSKYSMDAVYCWQPSLKREFVSDREENICEQGIKLKFCFTVSIPFTILPFISWRIFSAVFVIIWCIFHVWIRLCLRLRFVSLRLVLVSLSCWMVRIRWDLNNLINIMRITWHILKYYCLTMSFLRISLIQIVI